MGILSAVLDFLFPPKDTERIVRDCSLELLGTLVSPTLTEGGVTALLPYRHSLVRAVILEAKFKKNAKAISLLAHILSDYLTGLAEESEAFEKQRFVVVPIPLGKARKRERGYNQVEEVARKTGVAVSPLVSRIRDTTPQMTLSRKARLANMLDAFTVTENPDASVTYVLLDDVVTTGATLSSASGTLRASGATKVLQLALSH